MHSLIFNDLKVEKSASEGLRARLSGAQVLINAIHVPARSSGRECGGAQGLRFIDKSESRPRGVLLKT